jgi:hypothetical protein
MVTVTSEKGRQVEVFLSNNAVKQYERLNEPFLSRITRAIDKLE